MTADQPPRENPLRVVIADDQASVREGLVLLLGGLLDINVVGSAADGEQALALVAEQQPDAILLDLHMPVLDGIGATRRLAAEHPGVAVVVLTTYLDDSFGSGGAPGRRAQLPDQGRRPHRHRAGPGSGGRRADRLRSARARHAAVRRFGNGAPASGAEAASPAAVSGRAGTRHTDGLTQREVEILGLIAQGLTNPEIAERLFLSNHTVKTHINRIFAKTGSRDRVAAISYAQRHGIG